jgi:hypothetical protein
MSWGNCVQLLQLLDLEYEWDCAHQEERSDGEWGRHHGRQALFLGVCPCKEKKEEGGGMDGGGPGDDDRNDDQCDDQASLSPLLGGGEDVVSTPPGSDALERRAQLLDAIVVG